MIAYYTLSPGIKIYQDQGIAIVEKKITDVEPQNLAILKALAFRPLFLADIVNLDSNSKDQFLVQKSTEVVLPLIPNDLGTDYVEASRDNASVCVVELRSKCELHWQDYELKLAPGLYQFESHFPDVIRGDHQLVFFQERKLFELRDSWVMDYISAHHEKTVLELGCGKQARLAKKLLEQNPQLSYCGIDIDVCSDEIRGLIFVAGDFLQSIPGMIDKHTVIAEEVIEHLPQTSLVEFFRRIFLNGAHTILLTTPNKDFNGFLGVQTRHPDHKFEWSEKELVAWKNQLISVIGCSIDVMALGRKIEGISPTWAMIIKR